MNRLDDFLAGIIIGFAIGFILAKWLYWNRV